MTLVLRFFAACGFEKNAPCQYCLGKDKYCDGRFSFAPVQAVTAGKYHIRFTEKLKLHDL